MTDSVKNTPRCLILGCGAVATRMGIALLQQNWQVHAVKRTRGNLPPAFTAIAADIHQLDHHFFADREPFDAVIYSVTPDSRSAGDYQNAYVDGVSHILELSKANPPKFWLHFSSSRVWPQDDGSIVNEQTPISGTSAAAESLVKSEALIQQSGLAHSILRFSGIYGKTESSLLNRLQAWASAANNNSGTSTAEQIALQRWSNRIHVEDAANFAAFVLQRVFAGEAIEPLYAVTDNHPTQALELQDWARKALSLPAQTSISSENLNRSNTGSLQGLHKRIDNARLQSSGYQLMHPDFTSGYAKILANKD